MLWILVCVVVVGLVTASFALRAKSQNHLDMSVVAIGIVSLLTLAVAYFSYPVALSTAQNNAVDGYEQWLNGSIVAVHKQVFTCSEDGPCTHTYPCDSWTENIGTSQNPDYVTNWHDCPVATEEVSYWVTAVAWHTKDFYIVDHGFTANPQTWHSPYYVDTEYGDPGIPASPRGVPAQWLKAQRDLAAGNSDPVTVPDDYANYILASESTVLKTYSSDISMLLKRHLLPDTTLNMSTNPVYDNYLADKVTFVAMKPPANQADWQSAVMHLNAALGTELEGDLHVVVVRAAALNGVISPEEYTNALQAYWLNDLGKDAIAKNGIILVLGVNPDTQKIVWAGANTGMPIGNGSMLEALKMQLPGAAFNPNTVIGNTKARVSVTKAGDYNVSYTVGNGIVEKIVMKQFPFMRACMNCTSARDKKADAGQQGFVYLKTELPLSGLGVFVTIIIDLVILLAMWGIAYKADQFVREYFSTSNSNSNPTSTYSRYGSY